MVKTRRLVKEVFFSTLMTIVYIILYMYIIPFVFSRIFAYEEGFFISLTYVALACISTGLSIASRYVVKPLKIVLNVLSSIVTVMIVLFITNNGVFKTSLNLEKYTIYLQLDFSIVIYVLIVFLLTLAIVSAVTPSKS